MKKTPKISIMMISHNSSVYIGKAIQSVLTQNFKDWELIIVDDGSDDDTLKVTEPLLEDERIFYFKNEKKCGIPYSRNVALEKSNGEYLAVLDSDDLWLTKDKLKLQVDFLDNNQDYGVVGTNLKYIDPAEKLIGQKKVRKTNFFIKLFMPFWSQINNSSSLSRISLVRKVGGYDNSFKQSQDYDLWLKIGSISKMKNIRGAHTAYRIHDKNVSILKRKGQIWHSIRALKNNNKFGNPVVLKMAYYLKYLYYKNL